MTRARDLADSADKDIAGTVTLDDIILSNDITLADNGKAIFGAGSDLEIYHDGSNSYIDNSNGIFRITQSVVDGDLVLRADNGSGSPTPYLTLDGGAGHTTVQKEIQFLDSVIARFGNGNDMSIQHNGTDSLITNNTGDLYIQNTADDKDIIFQSDDGSGGNETYFYLDGSASSGNPFISDIYFPTE